MFFRIIRYRRPRRVLPVTPEVERLREAALAYLPGRLGELAERYGFEFNQVRIKHNVSNWGSCSSKRNINLNLNLMRLPAHLQDYVMLHELCHLRHMNHGPEFCALLESLCPDWKDCRRELKGYRLV